MVFPWEGPQAVKAVNRAKAMVAAGCAYRATRLLGVVIDS